MDKKILLAVDNTRPSRRAVRYAVQMSTKIPDLYFVLLHVQPMLSHFLKEEARTSVSARRQLEKLSNKKNPMF